MAAKATPEAFRSEAWLESPLRTSAGELQLAGSLQDVAGLDPQAMRVLGSYSLIYMVNVDGYYCDGNGLKADLRTGDLVVIFPELAHAYGPKGGQPWDQIYFVFNGPQFDFLRGKGLLNPKRPILHLEPVDYWSRRLEEIVAGEARHTEAGAMRAMGRFLHLLCDLEAADAEARLRPERDRWLEESQRLLSDPGEHGWPDAQQVARQVGLNYDNFRKQFALRAGVSPGQFQKRKRIDRACAAIYQGSHGFKELAAELEFCDEFHFSKAFKQITGLTPSEFRKKAHGG
ncbi:MAG: helix-turn-helix transcriptional regulator [Verrucomicrobia bacterium]|nr:helix-turn-helix transcriptional regulator [Verrucomicrobiota bacterium]